MTELQNRQWQRFYKLIVRFHSRHGHLQLPKRHAHYSWLVGQRKRLENGTLPPSQKKLLDKLGYKWGERALEAHAVFVFAHKTDFIREGPGWDFHFGELMEFRREHGHVNVPRIYPSAPKLPAWLFAQKTRHTDLTFVQISCLWEIGVRFGVVESRWLFYFFEFLNYRERLNNPNVPCIAKTDASLKRWVLAQRSFHKQGKLARHRWRLLDEIGFEWKLQKTSWEQRFNEVLEFKARFGHVHLPHRWAENPGLALWLGKQRRLVQTLDKERRKRLEDIGCLGSFIDQLWEKSFREWQTFAQEHGALAVPKRKEYPAIGYWMTAQRRQKCAGKLNAERIRQLEAAGFVWNPNHDIWEQRFIELKEYRIKYGHSHVPRGWSENHALGVWCRAQKLARKYGKLSSGQITRLNGLDFPWIWRAVTWDEMFRKLEEFRALYGHCRVPKYWPKNTKLYQWAVKQRLRRVKGSLSPKEIAQLDSLDFEWSYQKRKDGPEPNFPSALKLVFKFHAAHGRCPDLRDVADNPAAVAACGVINRSKTVLVVSQVLKLAAIGFDFGRRDNLWMSHFAKLAGHRGANGRVTEKDPLELASWCINQRRRKDQSVLDPYREKLLDEIGFRWLLSSHLWDIRFKELKAYKSRHGHCGVPKDFPNNLPLGRWVSSQRQLLRQGKLDPERKARLNAIKFVWKA